MRNLARRGVRVSCVECNPAMPGFRTVYGRAYLCPNPDDRSAEWLAFMIDLARKLGGKPVLIPSADQFVSAIAEHAGALAEHYTFCRGAAATQALLATKKRQYEIASDHGLPTPKTMFVRSREELLAFGREAAFPCLIKPVHFREWEHFPPDHPLYCQKTVTCNTLDEMEANYVLASSVSSDQVVQEIIIGPDSAKLVYLSCYGSEGRRIGWCMVRQVRTAPIYFGSASVVEPVEEPEADAACDAFLRKIGYVGLCEIELKRDSRDGKVRMIEANPRYSVTADASVYAGVDLGWLHYLDLIGKDVIPVAPSTRNFRHIVLERDFATIRDYRREKLLTWSELFRSYRSPVAFFDWDLRDWRVTAANAVKLAKILAKPLYRRFFPKRPPQR
jgi:predicted ATP-grasp superfamily ATP-dependent carboligase